MIVISLISLVTAAYPVKTVLFEVLLTLMLSIYPRPEHPHEISSRHLLHYLCEIPRSGLKERELIINS